ncbi:single-stranded DNA-binding protein 3-like isoform X36 [Tachypleus tridentatus]|uniref:single-stranded DNA-binding protein 3-like isoform X36 n=1 Tax=Tachypleus tridentatus TaxID=6853 RepID=UPI003FD1D4D4
MRRGKGSTVPSDNQAREKLALYVYEYLLHVGAQKAAQTFLSEIRWEKNITLGEPPGFLHSWWCVFWDLYCAAPERRDTCEHSSEAKAFHDYGFVNSGYAVNGMAHNPSAPSPLGQMPPNEGMPGGPIGPGGFFPVFMSPRYPGGPRPGVRMAQQVDFNPPGGVPGQPMMPNSMDPSRQGEGGEFVGWQGPPGMSPMNPRMNPPRGQPLGTMNPGNYGAIRPPPNSGMGPGGPGMSMPGPVGRPWQPNASTISYSSASPGGHYGPPVSSTGPPVPGTPIMPNPQDSSNSGGDGMYTLMKTVPGGNMPGFPMGPGPDGPMGPMGPDMGPPVMNGMSSTGDGLDGMKNSPANGPGTPREDGPPMSEFGIPGYGQENDQNESAAILKIKESMQEEAKRFEKATPSEHSEYFMQ